MIPDLKDFTALATLTETIKQKYGSIDGIDSLNEFWLETESRLRERFSVGGASGELMQDYKFKSRMKSRFASAKVPYAPFIRSQNKNDILDFATKQGFPLFCKPDNGVGSQCTHKLIDILQLNNFLASNNFADYIFELFIDGELYSFDGLCDKDGELVFTAAHRFYTPIDTLKQNGCECVYRTLPVVPCALYNVGTLAVKAFELKNSFFHIEFFKLSKPLLGVGEEGAFVALEANMRIAGGYTPEMLYTALGIDIYGLWAAVVSGEKPNLHNYTFSDQRRAVINIARKIGRNYKYTPLQLKDSFKNEFILCAETEKEENPFGNLEIVAAFTDEQRLNLFIDMAVEKETQNI